jgi:hypothetical protein
MKKPSGPLKTTSNLPDSVQHQLHKYAIAAAMQLARSSPRPR